MNRLSRLFLLTLALWATPLQAQRATGEAHQDMLYRLLGQQVRILRDSPQHEPIVGRLEGFRGDTILLRWNDAGGIIRIVSSRETLIQRRVPSSWVRKALLSGLMSAVVGGTIGHVTYRERLEVGTVCEFVFWGCHEELVDVGNGPADRTVEGAIIGFALGFGVGSIIGSRPKWVDVSGGPVASSIRPLVTPGGSWGLAGVITLRHGR